MKIYINEIFTSIEGEGIYLGTKTLFIRLAGCPLRCFWCDTPYALSLYDGKEYEVEEALKVIDDSIKAKTFKANLTGGEPLLQYKAVYEIAKHLKERGLVTYLESSCYDAKRFAYLLPWIDICKIEFKMKGSAAVKDEDYDRLIDETLLCLDAAIENKKIAYIKIVISNRDNLTDIRNVIGKIFKRLNGATIHGFVLQPAYGAEPSMEQLLHAYDEVYEHYMDVRIIPQIQKVMNIP